MELNHKLMAGLASLGIVTLAGFGALTLVGSFLFVWLYVGRNILRRIRPVEGEPQNYRIRIVAFLGMAGRIVALAAPIAAAAGYVTGANAALWSSVMTLGLVGLLIILQDFIADLYAMATGGDQSARDALMPVLVAIAMRMLA